MPSTKVKGIVIGRAEKESEMTNEKWITLIKNKEKLKDIPVVTNVDFRTYNTNIHFSNRRLCKN